MNPLFLPCLVLSLLCGALFGATTLAARAHYLLRVKAREMRRQLVKAAHWHPVSLPVAIDYVDLYGIPMRRQSWPRNLRLVFDARGNAVVRDATAKVVKGSTITDMPYDPPAHERNRQDWVPAPDA